MRGAVAHALEAEVARGHLDDDGQVAPRPDGHGLVGHLHAQNGHGFLRQAQPVVFLGGVPLLDVYKRQVLVRVGDDNAAQPRHAVGREHALQLVVAALGAGIHEESLVAQKKHGTIRKFS